ncbi:MAG: efflux RND transporter permease subunit [Stellaceae bacterium]
MSFAASVERHARSIVVIMIALAVAGIAAAVSLPVGLFPQVSFPRVVVDLSAGDRPAPEMALLVTKPVEQAIRSVPGVVEVRSATSRGSAQISIDFGWGRDMIATALLVDTAVGRTLAALPPGTSFNVRRMDPTVFPIIAYALTSDTLSPIALRDLAELQIVPLLSSIPGLARVGVQGGDIEEIAVLAEPQRLNAYGLAMSDLVTALSNTNVLQAAGRIEDHHKLYLVVANDSLHQVQQVADTVVKSDPNGIIRLSDVATVQDGVMPQWTRVVADGKPAVLLNIYEQPDGNAVQVAGQVRAKLASFAMPPGVTLSNWYDQSQLVLQSAGSVRDAVLIGLVLAGVVLLLFLRNWRVTLIALLCVPATLATTVLLLSFFGLSFNIMTLGGIAAAVGLVIDDVIVMVEHIARRAGGAPATAGDATGRDAVLPAGREFLRPLTGSSLATLIVFLPLGFLTGVTGAFSRALSITMASALIISYLISAFVVPVLARHLINFERWQDPGGAGKGWLGGWHARLLDRLFRAPWLIATGIVPLLVIGWVAYGQVATGFMPAVDEGGFVLDYTTLPGTSVTETDREVMQIEAILRAMPELQTFSRRTGLGLGGSLSEPNHGDFFVLLKPNHARPTPTVMADVLSQVGKLVPGVKVELAQLMEDLIGDLTAVPQPIEIKLFATDTAALIPQARKVAAAIAKIAGIVEVKDGVVLAGDGLDVQVDLVKAGFEGVTPDSVAKGVTGALTGTIATSLPQTAKSIGVRVRLPDALRLRDIDLADLPIRAPDGHIFPLRRVASIIPNTGQPEITRDNLQPMIAVTGRIEGQNIGGAVSQVQRVLSQPGMLGPGVAYQLGGLYQQQQIAFAGLTKVFAAALIAELVLLLFLYERFWLPIIIIGTSLLSTTAVFTALWVTGIPLNITALMGMTMIIGIGTEMAIFYVSEYTELAAQMPPRQALHEASRNRLRPITMTTLAAILTLLPLALAIGQGSAIQQPLAITIIAGLLIQFPLVLLAMPVLIGFTLRRKSSGDRRQDLPEQL